MLITPFYKLKLIILIIGDLCIAVLAYRFSFFLRNYLHFYVFSDTLSRDAYFNVTHYNMLLIIIQVLTLYFFGLYDNTNSVRLKSYFQHLIFSVVLCCLLLIMFYYFIAEYHFPRSIFFVFGFVNLLFLMGFRYAVMKVFSISLPPKNVVILGINKVAEDILAHMLKDKKSYNIKGFVSQGYNDETHFMGFPILGKADELMDIVKKENIDEIVVSRTNSWLDDIVHKMSLSGRKSRVTVVPSPYEILIGKLQQVKIHDIPLIEVYKEHAPSSSVALKRVFDIAFSLFMLAVTLPVMIILCIIIKATSKGPVLYKQERTGKDRVPFIIYKFRTMVADAEKDTGPVLAGEDDERVTRVGKIIRKFRIDEFPQLINILKGDMSFVGPRPERPYFISLYENSIKSYNARLKVKPGLTGLAQINGEYYTDPEIKLKYDLAYIYNQNIILDIIILAETFKLIFTGIKK